MTLDIRTIEPSLLKAELLRLRDEEHMDFLENLIGMDWGEEGGLGVVHDHGQTCKPALLDNRQG